MAQFQPNQANGQHKCEHCGAVYDVQWHQVPMRDHDSANCGCCGKPMADWNATRYPTFDLVGECPDDKEVKFL